VNKSRSEQLDREQGMAFGRLLVLAGSQRLIFHFPLQFEA
jgi:hypothetical protein